MRTQHTEIKSLSNFCTIPFFAQEIWQNLRWLNCGADVLVQAAAKPMPKPQAWRERHRSPVSPATPAAPAAWLWITQSVWGGRRPWRGLWPQSAYRSPVRPRSAAPAPPLPLPRFLVVSSSLRFALSPPPPLSEETRCNGKLCFARKGTWFFPSK